MRRTVGLVLAFFLAGFQGAGAARSLSFEDRVVAQHAIEEVYWRHRIWPAENRTAKPALDVVLPPGAMRERVADYLRKSSALEELWHRPITAMQLQAELNRMARNTHDPHLLQELFDALGGDAFVIAETLARQTLADRLLRNWYAGDDRFHGDLKGEVTAALARCADAACMKSPGGEYQETKQSFDTWWRQERAKVATTLQPAAGVFELPTLASGCVDDTWKPTYQDVPDARARHSVVWTGSEMIIWGGGTNYTLNTGARYDPATDTWTATSIGANVPHARSIHTAVWTGTEMIVWGGDYYDGAAGVTVHLNTGGRYDPVTDTWLPTSTGANVLSGRYGHSAVWTGTEMILWGGTGSTGGPTNDGARYDPAADTWTPTSIGANVPARRAVHTAVWTGTEMIVWGGAVLDPQQNTGGRYNPLLDTWLPTSVGPSCPVGRRGHTAAWTGTEMIIWGGYTDAVELNTGGRYDPVLDSWTPTAVDASVPGHEGHTAVWTGSEMIVWGGGIGFANSGSRYNPATDHWSPTSTGAGVPMGRQNHTAVWTGTEMIVWGGLGNGAWPMAGGRYNPSTDSWVSTSIQGSAPSARSRHSMVWTGTEMIVWGGADTILVPKNSGARYQPATDTWSATSTGANVPLARDGHVAVWTGGEMIVWGGHVTGGFTNTGSRYDPIADRWTPTSVGLGTPSNSGEASGVWTGRELIVWGGYGCQSGTSCTWIRLNTGGRYDPAADQWVPTATGANVPAARGGNTVVWTGSQMIVWGGTTASGATNTGARYNPINDTWLPTSTGTNVPAARASHSAVWSGTRMIVWGGGTYPQFLTSGGAYDPFLDQWTPTSAGGSVPLGRSGHAAVWTGAEMIVWGGQSPQTIGSTGGRYDPAAGQWAATSTAAAPGPRFGATGIWTGSEMIVWGGDDPTTTGGAYCACPGGRLVYRDEDGDGHGNAAVTAPSCDGSVLVGYALDAADCNDSSASVHPGAAEICNGIDDDCDGQVDEDSYGVDVDADTIHDGCDNCVFASNRSQSDLDQDGEGDVCDLDDGLIWEWRPDKSSIAWQAEQGPSAWNVYIGDLGVLKGTGTYTQAPGSNGLAVRHCAVGSTPASDSLVPGSGSVSFSLVSAVMNGTEGTLGTSSSGPRLNAHPCP